MRLGGGSLLVWMATLTLSTGVAPSKAPRYSIEVVSVPEGCEFFPPLHGLTGKGVAGVLACAGVEGFRGALWTDGVLTELGNFGGPGSYPYGTDSRGRIVGAAETPEFDGTAGGHLTRPFLWADGVLHALPTLGGPAGAAVGINTAGTVVGSCQAPLDLSLGREPTRACVWEDGQVRDLGDLGGAEAWAQDVNARGWIVGSSQLGGVPVEHAFLHDGSTMRDLGTLGGPASIPLALNDRGDVVGLSAVPPPPQQRGTHHAFLWSRGVMRDLGTLGDASHLSEARDINNRGHVVGRAFGPDNRVEAVLWDEQGIHRLSELVGDGSAWEFLVATDIDDSGRILVGARGEHGSVTLVLTPNAAH